MIFTTTQMQGVTKPFGELEKIMKSLGFVRWSWDYTKVFYDKKYSVDENTYYLRIQGNVINDKFLENPKALLKIQHPTFVEHFFPHGLNEAALVPASLESEISLELAKLEETLTVN